MALLGIQFVITLVVALFLQKLSPYYSFARWIMCSRLYRYLYPTNEKLRMLAGKPITAGKGIFSYITLLLFREKDIQGTLKVNTVFDDWTTFFL